ncbi:hypothetical protein K470DRAFT_213775 [Piedraia hortae CBS 480.64]|uniref:BHLH domain-containing protein n=1 Tax=Piedraia hortae CBS 480.64 TaxID=1314780 RepID=A0A6A7C449_9PEZI|nr:hypothetical protein K470DRAFT_213775 [Piedraia hortae CBS 480.64]
MAHQGASSSSGDRRPSYAVNSEAIAQPRLTEEQKRQNHIRSEQKRREAIRSRFDQLAEIVPGMSGQGRSEAIMLQASVEYLKKQLEIQKELSQRALDAGYTQEQIDALYDEARRQKKAEDKKKRKREGE